MLWMLVWIWETCWGLVTGTREAMPWAIDAAILGAFLLIVSRRRRPNTSAAFFTSPTRCIAHRGAALDAPENTMTALKYCVDKGCKNIEVDVRITKDGKCILAHDNTLCGKVISECDWAELKDLSLEDDHPMRARLDTSNPLLLTDAIDFFIANRVNAIIEIKETDKRIMTTMVETYKKYPILYNTTIVTSFNPIIIYKLRIMDSSIIGALNYRPGCFSTVSYNAVRNLRKRFPDNTLKHVGARILDEIYNVVWSTKILPFWTGCSAIILHKDTASPSVIEGWRKAKYSVFLWGVNQPLEKHYVVKILGVPYITDTLIGEPTNVGEMNGKTH